MANIARARPDDLDDLVAMNTEFSLSDGHQPDPDRARCGLLPLLTGDEHGYVLIARDPTTRHALGYAAICLGWSIEIGGREAVLDEIYTRDRGIGLGSELLRQVEDTCARLGVLRIFMETEAPNHRARNLYLRHGYEQQESIWMSKEL